MSSFTSSSDAMRLFLRRVLAFLLGLVSYVSLTYAANCVTATINAPRATTSILIAGDSHVQRALKPGAFESAQSMSQSAEPYFVTYWKLQTLLENAPVQTTFLGFTQHQISAFNDRKLIDPRWSREILSRVYSIEKTASLTGIEIDRWALLEAKLRYMGLYPKWRHDSFMGGYLNMDENMGLEPERSIKRHFYCDGVSVGTSMVAIRSLRSIVDLCSREGVEVVLITPPVHPSYLARIPIEFHQCYDELRYELEERGAKVWNYSQLPVAEQEFLDADHLNDIGATRFSRMVADRHRGVTR